MQSSSFAPLPVVLTPAPAASGLRAPQGWPAWDEVVTIRRRPEPCRPDQELFSSWDELLGCR
jgi:hypothetical protein